MGNNLYYNIVNTEICQALILRNYDSDQLSPPMSLRFDNNRCWFDRAAVFTGAAADAKFGANGGTVFIIGIDGMLRALLLTKQAQFPVGPTQAL